MEKKDLEEILKAQFPTQFNESTVEQVFSPMKMKIVLAAMLHCYNLGKGEVEGDKAAFDKDNWCIELDGMNSDHDVTDYLNKRFKTTMCGISGHYYGIRFGVVEFCEENPFAPVITFDQFKTLISKE